MPATTSEKILTRLKGLRGQMRENEQPLFSIPAIWDAGHAEHSTACDVVLTNQRLFGYIYTTFPRERLFLDALELSAIRAVSARQKNYDPVFRELFIDDGQRKVYIRAPRRKIEDLYAALRSAIETCTPSTGAKLEVESAQTAPATSGNAENTNSSPTPAPTTPIYGRQEIRRPLETSSTGIALLFAGGLILEIIGAVVWAFGHSFQAAGPLFAAGIFAVMVAIFVSRQRR